MLSMLDGIVKCWLVAQPEFSPEGGKFIYFSDYCRLLSLSWTMLLNAVVDQHAEWSVLNPGGSVLFLWVHCYLNFYFLSFFIKVWFILNIGCTLIVLNLFFTRLQRELLQRGMRTVVKMVVLDIRSDWKGLCICQ